ncbi:efflux RND transporter periplasmic adaptor subunit [Desulfococcaceae bacterium HSG9]|nr:efflux RND transporter periplasmic adaptor subunit [Desulfococcaceae bacterium HSG9]
MGVKLWRTGIILLTVSSLSLVFLYMPMAVPEYESNPKLVTATHADFNIEIVTVGVLDAARSHIISSAVKGNKGKIIYLIEDGEWVKQDDILVKLDSTPFENEVYRLQGEVQSLKASAEASKQMLEWEKNQVEQKISSARYRLQVAKLEYKQLVEGDGPLQLAQYEEEMEKARIEYQRYRTYFEDLLNLRKKGFDNPQEIASAEESTKTFKEKLETTKRRYKSYKDYVLPSRTQAARAKVKNSELGLEQTRQGSVFKIANAVAALNQVQAKLKTVETSLKHARNELEKTLLKAPFSGIAILYETFRDGQKRKPRVGDTVWVNQPLLYLPDITTLVVKTQVREIDLHKIALQQEGVIKIDAYPDASFKGQVSFIGALAMQRFKDRLGEKYFNLTIVLKDEDLRLRPGMTARVSILAEQVENALTIPIQSVFDERGKKYCYQFEGRRFKKKYISIGRQNDDKVEVLSGLQAGDRLSLVKLSPNELI